MVMAAQKGERYPAFVSFGAKLLVNVHDLNNEASTGNVMDIRTVAMIDTDGKRFEAPAISGRMIKHWHAALMRDIAVEKGLPLCDGCLRGEPVRPGRYNPDTGSVRQVRMAESEAVEKCVICDTHGYLIAQGAAAEEGGGRGRGKRGQRERAEQTDAGEAQEKGASDRRNSRALFSWALPVLTAEYATTQVVHTRVSAKGQMGESQEAEAGQMLFYKSYASETLGLVATLDLERIGFVDSLQESRLDDEEWRDRVRVAIGAFRSLLSGRMGASLSHALPHVDCRELLVAISPQGPLAVPTSPIYPGWVTKTAGFLSPDARLLLYGVDAPMGLKQKAQRFEQVAELFDTLMAIVG